MKWLLLLLFIPLPFGWLSASTTEVQPGQVFSMTASVYTEDVAPFTIIELRAPPGFTVVQGIRSADVIPGEPQTFTWAVQATSATPSLTPYVFQLLIDTREVDRVSVRVCCAKWPDAKRGAVVWLPMVAKSP